MIASERVRRQLGIGAWLAVIVHLAAGLAMLFVLRDGLDTNPDVAGRAEFIASHTSAWRWAWFTWNLSAISMLVYVSLFVRWGRVVRGWSTTIGWLIVGGCLAAVAFDLTAEMILMWRVPELAERVVSSGDDAKAVDAFVSMNRSAVVMTGLIANGLYTTVSVVLCVKARYQFAPWITACGLGVGGAGYWLSAAALLGSVSGMFWANVFLVPCILGWMSGVGWSALGRASSMEVTRSGRQCGKPIVE